MKKIMVSVLIGLGLSVLLVAQGVDAEMGIKFLKTEMNNPGLKYEAFAGRSGLFELRLYVEGGTLPGLKEKLVEVVPEFGSPELYSFEEKKKTFLPLSSAQRMRGGSVVKVAGKEFRFICSLGGARVTVD